eukprot:scaffold225_cov388-Prasinococcus_capsulatus_cf.AAC.16
MVHKRHMVERVRSVLERARAEHTLAPHACLLDLQCFPVHPQRLLEPVLIFVHVRHSLQRARARHTPAPHACLLDLQRIRVHPQRLLVPLLLVVHVRHVVQPTPCTTAAPPRTAPALRARAPYSRAGARIAYSGAPRMPLRPAAPPCTPAAPPRTAPALSAPPL